ncbi:MAG: hypothetical protein JJT78_05890 [Leptospira sp.]|nr:hypothetical protein [Leptospira sp.]
MKEYPGVIVLDAYRERSIFYNPNGTKPKGIYFATIKESDGPNDKSSHLDREGVYRLSIGIGKKKYQEIFGKIPDRPTKGGVVNIDIDFQEIRKLTPHPIYAWLGWVCINNPEEKEKILIRDLFDLSYDNCIKKYK